MRWHNACVSGTRSGLTWLRIYKISLLLFFQLGFLLGKFVAERQQRIRQIQQSQYPSVDHSEIIKQINIVQRNVEAAARNVSDHTPITTHSKLNQKLWSEWSTCSAADRPIELNFSDKFDVFADHLVEYELNQILGCLIKLIDSMKIFGSN